MFEQTINFFGEAVKGHQGDLFVGKLADGYKLINVTDDGQLCGDGGETVWALLKNNKLQHVFRSCHCGRGCGNKACVRDDWGYHDCEPELEAVRTD